MTTRGIHSYSDTHTHTHTQKFATHKTIFTPLLHTFQATLKQAMTNKMSTLPTHIQQGLDKLSKPELFHEKNWL